MEKLLEELKKLYTPLKEPIKIEEYKKRAIEDLDIRKFVSYFFSPYSPEDSLDYMCEELVTLKTGEKLKFYHNTFQELISKPELTKRIEKEVETIYKLKSWVEKRPLNLERELSYISHEKIREIARIDYEILKNYTHAISNGQKLEAESGLFKEFKDFSTTVAKNELYKISESVVWQMENFGKAKILVEYDWFNELKGILGPKDVDADYKEREIKNLKEFYLKKLKKAAIYAPFGIFTAASIKWPPAFLFNFLYWIQLKLS
jgi:hypothetical protein